VRWAAGIRGVFFLGILKALAISDCRPFSQQLPLRQAILLNVKQFRWQYFDG
jgi:hypothetical protein